MWNKISKVATEAIEAAKDIKQHIAEVTNDEDFGGDEEETVQSTGNEHFDNLATENSVLKSKIKELAFSFENEKKNLIQDNQKLLETVRVLEAALAEKEKESVWEAENYQQELQEILKSKNKVQRELEKATNELINAKNSENSSKVLMDEVEKLKNQIKILSLENKEVAEEREEWKKRYENYTRAEEDKVSRSFFIQFVGTYSQNVYNPEEREKMINSLVDVLHLTGEERSVLSLKEVEEETRDGSLFDQFNKFLSGFSG